MLVFEFDKRLRNQTGDFVILLNKFLFFVGILLLSILTFPTSPPNLRQNLFIDPPILTALNAQRGVIIMRLLKLIQNILVTIVIDGANHALLAGPSSSPGPMQIVRSGLRKVEVYDMCKKREI